MVDQTIPEKIRQRRAQMLIHSCLYYQMDESIVDDHTWQWWADELTELQNEYPEHCSIGYFDKEFEGWDGSSGYHLPLRDPYVYRKAEYILRLNQEKTCVQTEQDVIQYNGNLEDFMS